MTPRIKNQIKQAKFPAILYPEIPNKKSLTSEEFIKVDLLIVLDGTWRKAKRLLTIDPILETLPYLSLNIEKPKLYTLRKSQKTFQYSTLESVTYALEAIEKKSFSKALYVLEKQMSLQKSFNSQKKK